MELSGLQRNTRLGGKRNLMSIFTRRHHQAIAEVVAETRRTFKAVRAYNALDGTECLARNVCATFLRDNPNFDREKFLKTCGMEGE